MPYTVYRTTNLVNGNFYLGCHKTLNPSDEYLGSGWQILKAIQKHGRQNFKKEVLFVSLEATAAFKKEKELIAEAQSDPACYNMHEGGYGGWDYVNRNRFAQTPEAREKGAAKRRGRPIAESVKQAVAGANRKRVWTREARRKLGDAARIHRIGKPRPQSVKFAVAEANRNRAPVRWIHRHGVALKIEVSQLEAFFAEGWQLGRK
jgi:hypothetical protein